VTTSPRYADLKERPLQHPVQAGAYPDLMAIGSPLISERLDVYDKNRSVDSRSQMHSSHLEED
jgi:hypothetical protein